nr:MAG TPA: hypothetical protein [Caudoviricetes sp.]
MICTILIRRTPAHPACKKIVKRCESGSYNRSATCIVCSTGSTSAVGGAPHLRELGLRVIDWVRSS